MANQTELTKSYLSPCDEKDVIVVKNIPLNASNDTLENYLEVICDADVDSIYFHQLPDHNHVREVAVVFLKEKVKDIDAVNQKASKKSLEGSFVQVCRLGDPGGVIVYNIPRKAVNDEIALYFERRVIAGPNAEVVECKIHDRIQVAVLQYDRLGPALQSILKTKHTIREADVTVEPYYKDFHDNVIQALHELYDPYTPISDDENKNSNNKMNRQEDEKPVEKRGDNPRISASGSRIRLLSADMKEFVDKDGYEIPVTGKVDKVEGFQTETNTNYITPQFSETTRSEHVYCEIGNDDFKPPVPMTPRPSEIRHKKPVTEESKEDVKMEKGKIILLRIKGLNKDCKECRIDLNSDTDVITFVGSKDSILAAKLQMYQLLEEIKEVTKPVSHYQATYLKSKSGWIKGILKKEKIVAYCMIKQEDTLCCQAFLKDIAEKGLNVVLSNLEKSEIPYTEAHFKFVNSDNWKSLVSDQNKVEIEMVRDKKLIVVHGKKADCQSVADLIRKELNKHAEAKSEKIEIKGRQSICFHHGHKQDIERLKADMSRKHGSLNYKHEKQSIVIELKGDPGLVEDVKTEIQQMKSLIWQGQIDLQKISKNDSDIDIMSRVLTCDRGKKFISAFEEKHKCGVDVQRTRRAQQLHHVNTTPTVNRTDNHELHRRSTSTPDLGARPKEYVSAANQRGGNNWICSSHEGSVEIILKQGNIVNERADILVNVVADWCKFNTGVIPQNFLKKGGPDIEREYMIAKQENERADYLVTGKAGSLQCKSICHITLPKWKGDKTILSTAVRNCLQHCSRKNFESIAFPAVGTGQLLRYPVEEVVSCLMSEAKEAAKRSPSIKKIKFVAYDDHTVNEFKQKLQGSSASGGSDHRRKRNRSDDREDNQSKDKETDKYKETEIVLLELYAVSKSEGEKVRSTLSAEIKDTFLQRDNCKNDKIKSLSTDTWKKLTSAAKKHYVWLDRDKDNLVMIGEKDAVIKTKAEILEILLKEETVHGGNSRSNSNRHKKGSTEYWMSKSEDKTVVPFYWKHFTKKDGILDKVKDTAKGLVGINAHYEDVDSETFKQISNLVLKTWDGNVVGQGKDATGLTHKTLKITRVQRVENFGVFDSYYSKKRDFYRKLGSGKKFPALENVSSQGKKAAAKGRILTTANINKSLMVDMDLCDHANEHYLFHGTAGQFADNIAHKGADDKLSGDKGMFGSGIYCAESATKADQYADDSSARQKTGRKMFMMRVLLGNIFVTAKPNKYKIPPCSYCMKDDCVKHLHERFDSVVADGPWLFREFVIYRGNQCYPEYLITYDRI